ncbi:hypothetical protein K2X14_07795 [Acetobacter sp. TBRC 12305]|uniref:Uncharacterized protein n=1 Tax=Acetobacter garciniae TaxID=2817435 RepID=A0A939HP23_9PROT|nr:hypothetical protein [Acetobacter garciniae]MBO1325293.1 hypothetical protein [Acetobacter garciniae]MBX0344735.1 hypothetical protein [Acetobacter garciniae]
MADDLMTLEQVFSELNTQVAKAGGNNAFARRHGRNKSTISNWANCNREVSDACLDALGLERVEMFRRKQPTATGGARNG